MASNRGVGTMENREAGADPRVMDALPSGGSRVGDQHRRLGVGLWQREVRDGQVHVTMTMTTPACPMEELLMEMVHSSILRELPEARSVEVDLVWEPSWKPDMMVRPPKLSGEDVRRLR